MDEASFLKPRILKALPLLRAKVGTGTVTERNVQIAQKIINNNDVDFVPLAQGYLASLAAAIAKLKERIAANENREPEELITPVMELKGNAPMFDYPLIGDLAGLMLDFLESIGQVDDDVIEFAEAHHKTLTTIVNNRMTGDGGSYGAELKKELRNAIDRYFAKRGRAPAAADAFFVDIDQDA